MTLKEFRELTKDMPEDAKIKIWEVDYYGNPSEISEITTIEYNNLHNRIELC